MDRFTREPVPRQLDRQDSLHVCGLRGQLLGTTYDQTLKDERFAVGPAQSGLLFAFCGKAAHAGGIYVGMRAVISCPTMSAAEQRINDLLFIRDGILLEMRQTADDKRIWELYLLKRDLDQQLLALDRARL